jgi:phosphatidylinositol alpha-1,6-mannosyltransferase
LGLCAGQKLILSVGRLQRRKGFDMVIRSLPSLVTHGIDVHYALIGMGQDSDYLSKLSQKLGLAERVHMLGRIESADLPRWYNACNVFVMPNREINGDTEGFGMVFLEAAACGRPVIAGKAGGTGSAVVDGVTGMRIDGDNLEQLCNALLTLLVDDALAARLGAAGHARANAKFGWQVVARKTAALSDQEPSPA